MDPVSLCIVGIASAAFLINPKSVYETEVIYYDTSQKVLEWGS